MKDVRRLTAEIRELRARLEECEETLSAIRSGEVDAIVVAGARGARTEQVFTLAGTENAYRVFVEAMEEGALTVSASGIVLYSNKAFAKLLGKPLEGIIGSSIFDSIPTTEKDKFEAVFRQARNNSIARSEFVLSRPGGEQVPVFVSARSCIEFGAKAICMVVTDLTEQKRNEQIVADGKLARLILQHASEPMAVCDSTGRVLHCNRAFQELCGGNPLLRSFDEVMRLEVVEGQLHRSDEKLRLHFSVRDALAGQEFHGLEVCFRPRYGDPIHLLLSTGPLLLPNAQKAGVLITLFNIEERRRTEAALRRSEKLAATGRLAASIAHEINNPLAALTNLLFLIQSEAVSAKIAEYAQTAQEELARVAHITRQTLAFYRESNAPGDVNLVELIESALFLYASTIRNKHLSVRREIRYTGQVHGFSNELRQVFSNLLGNAIEALPVGGTVRIRVYASHEWSNSAKPGIRIVIGDAGKGISAADQGHLFEPFFTTKGEKGTGLGLWVSQGIVEKHGGFIRLRSNARPPNTGTVFSIFLPEEGIASRQAVA